MAVSRFEGNTASLADVLDELRMLPFFAKRRVVFVEDADPFVTKNRKELEAHVEAPVGTSGVLVLMVKTWPANTKLYRQVAAAGLAIDCNSPGEKELIPWLGHHAAKQGADLDADAARLLVELVGAEVGLLAAEVEKLAVYVGPSRPDPPRRCRQHGRGGQDRDGLESARRRHRRESRPRPSPTLTTCWPPASIRSRSSPRSRPRCSKVHHAGRLRAARLSLDEACRIAGIRDFAVDKTRRQHAHLGPARVDQLPACS